MLSSYTTSTFVKFFFLHPFNRLKKFPECGIICIESTSILLFLPTESKRFRFRFRIFFKENFAGRDFYVEESGNRYERRRGQLGGGFVVKGTRL